MSLAARWGNLHGFPFMIERKDDGLVKAEVNKKKQKFGSWKAAEQWITDEVKRINRK